VPAYVDGYRHNLYTLLISETGLPAQTVIAHTIRVLLKLETGCRCRQLLGIM
jgi:hypothetical protein